MFSRSRVLRWTKLYGLGLGFRQMVHGIFFELTNIALLVIIARLCASCDNRAIQRLARVSDTYASFREFSKSRKTWPILNPPIFGWGCVLDEWYLPILYSGGPIFRKYLSIFCILYGCGGNSGQNYEKSSGIIIIRISILQCNLAIHCKITNFVRLTSGHNGWESSLHFVTMFVIRRR